ncbi:TPA: HNH endonuclease [Yersinia enterocolitica]
MDYSLSELSEVFSCDIVKGELYWNARGRDKFNNDFSCKMWNLQYAGKLAGGIDGQGYRQVTSGYMKVRCHRAVWVFAHGDIPESLYIDHINHIRSDNRINNLRLVTHHQNMKNQAMHSRNTTGANGVGFDRATGKWKATLTHLGSYVSLGYFDSKDQAIKARNDADKRFNFHSNHGRDRYLDTPYIDPWNRIK